MSDGPRINGVEPPSVLDLVFGLAPVKIIHVAARLGIADLLADGARTSVELAETTGTHERSLYRLLRGLACLGVVAETGPARFELAPAGQPLRTDAPDSIRQLVMLTASDEVWRSWGDLEYSVRTGRPAWEHVNGQSGFEFFAQHPEQRATFNAAMADHTRSVAPALIAGYDLTGFGTLVDLGGGDGTLIAAILRAVPGLRGVLCDLPPGLESAATTLAAAGVADRCQVVAGSFFDSVPQGADAYLLKSVIHDWDDEKSVTILSNVRKAMPDTGRVLVVEPVLPPTVSSPVEPAAAGDVMSDLNMLVLTGGRERTEEEFHALYAAADLELTELVGPLDGYRVIVGAPVSTTDSGERVEHALSAGPRSASKRDSARAT